MDRIRNCALAALAVLIAVLPGISVSAANITGALYSGTVRVVNSSYTAQNVSVPFTLSADTLIDGHYINPNMDNIAITDSSGQAVPFMPSLPGDDEFFIFIPQISQSASLNYKLSAGGPPMSPQIVYFPGDNGMTTDDSPSMDLSGDFEIIIDGYIDTSAGADKKILSKDGSLELYVSDDGEISLDVIFTPLLSSTAYLLPSADGSVIELAGRSGYGDNWQQVNDGVGVADTTDYVRNYPAGKKQDLYELSDPVFPPGAAITGVRVYMYCRSETSSYVPFNSTFRIGGGDIVLGPQVMRVKSGWTGDSADITGYKPGGGEWTIADINNLEAGVYVDQAAYVGNCAQLYVLVDYTYPNVLSLAASGVESGEHKISLLSNGTNAYLYIDGVLKDSEDLGGMSIAQTASDWEYCLNGSVPYLNSLKTYVSGSLVQHIEWEYDDTVFTDKSGKGNDAYPTFRATSSDPDVTASFLNFGVIPADGPGTSHEGTTPIITAPPEEPPQAYGDMNIQIPGGEVINSLLKAGRFPLDLFWYPMLFGLVAAAGMVAFHATRSVLLQSMITGVGIAIVSLGILQADFWVVIPYVIVAIAILTSRKTVSL